jgi:hypothetical protein
MSGLSALKLVQAKPTQGTSPKYARRQKLSSKLHEQIQLAKAEQAGTQYQPTKLRTVKDALTGESRKVETPKRIKVRYGARTLEVIEGKNAIETDSIAGVVTTLEVLRSAVDAGELDARIEAISGLVKSGFDKEAQGSKRPTLKLPSKSA